MNAKLKNVLVASLLVFFCANNLQAANGDSVVIRSFDNFHMNRYGNFDQWVFINPQMPKSQRIFLKYTLGCLSNGQCEWDYTIKLFARQRTGINDSTLQQAPNFRVKGQALDSLWYSKDTTYSTTFNTQTKSTDSLAHKPELLVLFNNPAQPLSPNDSIWFWPSNYYLFHFDASGNKTDSFWVAETHKINRVNTPYYSVFEVINDVEVGRFISPYAKTFPKSFKYDYVFDVSDYAALLKDSVELRIQYQGYSYGFTATMDLIFVEGTPVREAIKVENIYSGGFPYGRVNNSIENYLPEKDFVLPSGVGTVKAKVFISGHGMEENENCAEFCAKNYFLKHNKNIIATQKVWKDDCGKNAIANQPGTWIYDRSNWCPGEVVPVYEYDLDINSGSAHTIDLDMEPFTANGDASYNLAVQLIYYKPYNYELDLGIEEIIAPSKNFWHNRINPICDNASIRIKNHGKTKVESAEIKYTAANGLEKSYVWKGELASNKTTEVVLPYIDWSEANTNKFFTVNLAKVNGISDANPSNDRAISEFEMPLVLPEGFVIETRTNNRPQQNSYTIKNNLGQTLFTKTFSEANVWHRDTFRFNNGCYTFRFEDAGKNGLGFWAQAAEGNGNLRIVSLPSPNVKLLRNFNVDFGTFVQLHFVAQYPLKLNETLPTAEIKVFPVPANNTITLSSEELLSELVVYSPNGTKVMYQSLNDFEAQIDLTGLKNGLYVFYISDVNGTVSRKKIPVINGIE